MSHNFNMEDLYAACAEAGMPSAAPALSLHLREHGKITRHELYRMRGVGKKKYKRFTTLRPDLIDYSQPFGWAEFVAIASELKHGQKVICHGDTLTFDQPVKQGIRPYYRFTCPRFISTHNSKGQCLLTAMHVARFCEPIRLPQPGTGNPEPGTSRP